MEGQVVAGDRADVPVRVARDRLIATYENALRQSEASPRLEGLVLRAAIAANSATAAERLAAGWAADVASPMARFAAEMKPHDPLGKSMWPGGSILLAQLGLARVVLALLLGVIAWLLRTSGLPDVVQLVVCVLVLSAMLYVLGGAHVALDVNAEQLDGVIRGLVDPDQRDFFALLGGSPPMTEPARVLGANVAAARRLLMLGLVGAVVAPLVASVLNIVRSVTSSG